MKLRSVTLGNFRSYRASYIEFTDGVMAIAGANGSGKSSLFEAVYWALFGISRTRTQDELVRAGERNVSVHVRFDHNNEPYEVSRLYSRGESKGGTTELKFYESGTNRSGATIAETQAKIAALIGSWDVISATSYVGQGQGDVFMRARPAERRDLFARSLAIDKRWDEWHEKAKAELVELHDDRQMVSGSLSRASDKASTLANNRDAMHEAAKEAREAGLVLAQAETLADDLRARLASARAAQNEKAAAAKRVTEARYRAGKLHAEITDLRRRIVEAQRLINDKADIIARWEERRRAQERFQVAMEDYRRERDEYDAANMALRGLEYDLETAEATLATLAPAANCPTCGQPLERTAKELIDTKREAAEQVRASAKQKIDELRLPAKPSMPVAPKHDTAADTEKLMLDTAERDLPRYTEQIADKQQEHAAALSELAEMGEINLDAVESEVRLLEEQERRNKVQLISARERKTTAAKHLAVAEERVMVATEAAEEERLFRATLTLMEKQIATWTVVAEGCGPRGVRQLIAEQALAMVETGANARLEVLQPGYYVHFSTLSESGRETLEIGVSTPEGIRAFESLSGGEGTRVAIAVRLAMATVTANAHGIAALPSIIMDEAFSNQDSEGKQAFVQCIADLARTVGQVIVVTHDAEFQDRFDNKIVMRKEHGVTEVLR